MRQPDGMFDPNATNARSLDYANSDLAFGMNGRLALQGNFHGLIFYNIEDPTKTSLQRSSRVQAGRAIRRSGATSRSCPSRAMDGSIAAAGGPTAGRRTRCAHRQQARHLRPEARQLHRRRRRRRAADVARLRPIQTACMECESSTSPIRGSRGRSRACRRAAVRTRIRSSRIRTTRRTSTSTSPAVQAFDRLRRRRAVWPIRTRRTRRPTAST
jgi:hypothetical protein